MGYPEFNAGLNGDLTPCHNSIAEDEDQQNAKSGNDTKALVGNLHLSALIRDSFGCAVAHEVLL
jgi:hypothetical protein